MHRAWPGGGTDDRWQRTPPTASLRSNLSGALLLVKIPSETTDGDVHDIMSSRQRRAGARLQSGDPGRFRGDR